jgi:hypothetical protein
LVGGSGCSSFNHLWERDNDDTDHVSLVEIPFENTIETTGAVGSGHFYEDPERNAADELDPEQA